MTIHDVITKILEDEGGIADVHDGKGVTRFGQTPQWLDDNGLVPPSSAADAAANYEAWMQRVGLTAICERDGFVGWIVTDMAVHSGLTQAVKTLQRALGVTDDGAMGPQTRQRFEAVAGQPMLARKLVAERVKFVGSLLASTSVDRRKWARGWMNRLARQIEAIP